MTGLDTTPVPVQLPALALHPRRLHVGAPVVALVGLVAVLLGGFAVTSLLGLSFFVVQTPSMGRTAPVGTLIVSERPAAGSIRVGDIVTYRSPDEDATVTHRVVGTVAGGYRLQGDINGAADARTVAPSMVVGRAVAVLPGVGWAIRLAPWLAIGALSVWALTLPVISSTRRAALRLIGVCAVVTVVLLALRPLIAFDVLSRMPTVHGMTMAVVPTGLLPVRLSAQGGGSVDAQPGQVVQLLLPADHTGRVTMTSGLALDPLGWIVLVLLCLLPLIAVVTIGLPSRSEIEQ